MSNWDRHERGSGSAKGERTPHLAPTRRAMRDVALQRARFRIGWATSQDGQQRPLTLGAQDAVGSARIQIATDPVAPFDRLLHSLLADTKRLGNVFALQSVHVLQPHNRA